MFLSSSGKESGLKQFQSQHFNELHSVTVKSFSNWRKNICSSKCELCQAQLSESDVDHGREETKIRHTLRQTQKKTRNVGILFHKGRHKIWHHRFYKHWQMPFIIT